MISSAMLRLLPLLAAVAHATDFRVDVGLNGLTYTPDSLNATVDDTITFTFHQKNHTVTQSTFESPCTPLSGGVSSPFMPVSNTTNPLPTLAIQINNTDSIWFHCEQQIPSSHCAAGMVFAVNTSPETFTQFKAAAMASGTGSNGSSTTSSFSGTGISYGATPTTTVITSTGGQSSVSTPSSSSSGSGVTAALSAGFGVGITGLAIVALL